jgi:ketosteroid isomerase-like protein
MRGTADGGHEKVSTGEDLRDCRIWLGFTGQAGGPTQGTCAATRSVRHTAMRTLLAPGLILCLLASVVIPAAAQEKDKSDAEYIRSMELKWTESYKQRQVAMLSSLLADDFVITIEDGNTYSKTGYISHSAEPGTRVEVAEMSDLKVRMHGNTAIVTGAYHERGESNGKRYEYHDRLTDVWMKVGGKWQVVASHYSVPVK